MALLPEQGFRGTMMSLGFQVDRCLLMAQLFTCRGYLCCSPPTYQQAEVRYDTTLFSSLTLVRL